MRLRTAYHDIPMVAYGLCPRTSSPTSDQDLLPTEAVEIYRRHGLDFKTIVALLTEKKLSQLPNRG